MTKKPTSAKSPPTLPSLKTFLQPGGRLSEARFSEESNTSREDTLAARSVARFAASFGVDTRLGISCFSLSPESSTVVLDLEKLRVAILACNPEKNRKYTLDCKRLLQERLLEGKKELTLTQNDLVNLRLCANSHYDAKKELPEGLGRPHEATKKPHDILAVLKEQAGPLGSAWGDTMWSDDVDALSCLSNVLSAILGAEVPRPMNCHVQLGLRPTEQCLRTRGEYLEDSAQTLLALEEVGEWRKEVTDSVRKEELKPSAVHTRKGDVINAERRVSYSRSGGNATVFDLLENELLHELSADMKGFLAVYRGHYDFVYYSPGGFFSKHVDHVNAYGPGLCCWHVLVCLDAEACEGGQTLVYSEDVHASSASVTPGGVLVIRSGVPHEGSVVEKGIKVLLKFDLFQFQDDSISRKKHQDEMVLCECHDGVCHMERGLLLHQPFFERMMAFEGPREVLRLGGFLVSECQALRRFLVGDASLADDPAEVAKAHEVLEYILAPEASMTLSEFRNFCTDEYVLTKDRRAARRLASMANDEYAFFGVIQSWSIHIEDIWDLCLDYCMTEVFTSSVCVISAGSVVMLTAPGPRWKSGQESGQIDLPELNKEVFIFEDPSPQSNDTFATMDGLLKKQVCVSSVDYWKLQKTPCENLNPSTTSRRTSLSALDATKLTKLLVRNTPRDDFRSILESCVGMARFRHELVEDACNDGESFLTTTRYESRVYEFEWLLMKKSFLQPAL